MRAGRASTVLEQTMRPESKLAVPSPRAAGRRWGRALCVLSVLSALPGWASAQAAAQAAQTAPAALPLLVGQGAGGASYSVPVQTLLFFTALSFLPAVLLMMTGFTRIVIVLGLLRQALGTQAAPPNQVIVGLSLFLTLFVMGPTLDKVYNEAYKPFAANQIGFEEAVARGEVPMRQFMLKQTRQSDLALFTRLAKLDPAIKAEQAPLRVLVPAFVTSELKSAFQIGFLIFIPFLVIDMVVASVLMSLGMMMLSPVLVALPFKLMLFVLADGWNLLLGSLAASFAV
jgi:flagellar biosynthetic protein FliP